MGNLPGKAVAASLGDLVTREISWIGSYRFVDEITDAVAAMENGLDVTPLITHRYPINEAAQAITVAADRTSTYHPSTYRTGACRTSTYPATTHRRPVNSSRGNPR